MPSTGPTSYVYGVVRSSVEPTGTGIGRARLRSIALDDIAALASPIASEELQAGRTELLCHSRVLERALERGTVLPMRFGIVLADDTEVREQLLEPFYDELLAQLDELEGKVEVDLRAVYDERALMTEIRTAHPEIAAQASALDGRDADGTYFERIALGQMVAEALERTRESDTATIIETLDKLALASDVSAPEHERVATHASFLVERSQLRRFDRAVDELGRHHASRLRFKYVGPLPPYSFVQLPEAA